MNYCDKIHYSLLTASPEDFPSMIDSFIVPVARRRTYTTFGLVRYAGFKR